MDYQFGGIDFSLAPFPDDAHSLGNAVEKMGVPRIGLHGSLAAAAILTEAIDRADFPTQALAASCSQCSRIRSWQSVPLKGIHHQRCLLYSAVCGTGLDCIPLPGDTTSEHFVPLLLDLCALALRLDKPLTARLMPVPGKKAGDQTNFNFAFFAPSKVMASSRRKLIPRSTRRKF